MRSVLPKLVESYREQFSPFRKYWSIYGGWPSFVRSIYFSLSLLLTVVGIPIWTRPNWWQIAFDTLPSLIGFLIGAFALLISFGGDRFQKIMATAPSDSIHSALDLVAASFCHFLVTQFFTLFLCVGISSIYSLQNPLTDIEQIASLPLWGIGFFLLMYSLACGLAATMAIFKLSTLITRVTTVSALPSRDEGEAS